MEVLMNDPEWTDADLDLLQSLDAAGTSSEQIARRLGRSVEAIEAHLRVAREREGILPVPQRDPDEGDWNGPDEEGEVQPPTGRPLDDPAAWVHSSNER
jgi:hypothetical protein